MCSPADNLVGIKGTNQQSYKCEIATQIGLPDLPIKIRDVQLNLNFRYTKNFFFFFFRLSMSQIFWLEEGEHAKNQRGRKRRTWHCITEMRDEQQWGGVELRTGCSKLGGH